MMTVFFVITGGHFILKNDQSNSILISPAKSEFLKRFKINIIILPNPKETIILFHNNDHF